MNTVAVVVPTIGRRSLAHTLASIITAGVRPEDEVLVVADGKRELAEVIVGSCSLPCAVWYHELVPAVGGFGGEPRNWAMKKARADWILFLDDDDAFTDGAITYIREFVEKHVLHVFRTMRDGAVLWDSPVMSSGNVGTPMYAIPNEKPLPHWGGGYTADYDWGLACVKKFGEPVFDTRVISTGITSHGGNRDMEVTYCSICNCVLLKAGAYFNETGQAFCTEHAPKGAKLLVAAADAGWTQTRKEPEPAVEKVEELPFSEPPEEPKGRDRR